MRTKAIDYYAFQIAQMLHGADHKKILSRIDISSKSNFVSWVIGRASELLDYLDENDYHFKIGNVKQYKRLRAFMMMDKSLKGGD